MADQTPTVPSSQHVPALDLRSGDTLLGEAGGASLVTEDVHDGSLLPGFVTVTTEHGPLLLDNDPAITYPIFPR